MNKIEKFLSKLSAKEKAAVLKCLEAIHNKNFKNLNLGGLKGFDNLYRIRKYRLRIVFYMDETETRILRIDRRDDSTYKNL